jgi:hypothetical protein
VAVRPSMRGISMSIRTTERGMRSAIGEVVVVVVVVVFVGEEGVDCDGDGDDGDGDGDGAN